MDESMYTSRLSQGLNSKNFRIIEQCFLLSNLPLSLVNSVVVNDDEVKFKAASKERSFQSLKWPNKFFFEVFKRLLAVKQLDQIEISLEDSLKTMVSLFGRLSRQSVIGTVLLYFKILKISQN